MSRDMIVANGGIFSRIDQAFSRSGNSLPNSATNRWIATEPTDRKFLKNAHVRLNFHLSPQKRIVAYEFDGKNIFVVSGLSFASPPPHIEETELNGAYLTAFLDDAGLQPLGDFSSILDYIGNGHLGEPGYSGHPFSFVSAVFPPVRVFASELVTESSAWRAIFFLCLSEAFQHDGWIDREIFDSLNAVSELDPLALPYDVLARSIFDADRSSIFLAIYRCLEGLYAYKITRKFARAFSLDGKWTDISQKMEHVLGWRPKEEASLAVLFSYCTPSHLNEILLATGLVLPEIKTDRLPEVTAKHVYAIRNSYVHYRSATNASNYENVDWTKLCSLLGEAVCYVYDSIYQEDLALSAQPVEEAQGNSTVPQEVAETSTGA